MGREVRMIAPGWEHPRHPDDHYDLRQRGRYIPLYQSGFAEADAEWNEGYAKWQEGFVQSYGEDGPWRPRTPEDGPRFTEWAGSRPSPDDYMPEWPARAATLLVMYENTSEGTPISPAFETPEELARWLADTNASAFAGMTASYEQWLTVCRGGWAPSMVVSERGVQSGVAALETPPSDQREAVVPRAAPLPGMPSIPSIPTQPTKGEDKT
jgi:hypothetical protein